MSSDIAGDNSSSESESGWTNLRMDVLHCLLDVESAGSFTTFCSFEKFILPGISVDDVGPIGLPLSLHDAQSLVQASRQAPFGRGSQTLVDETVRKTWEIDGSKVSFLNEAWHSWLGSVVQAAAKELGVAGDLSNVRAELDKMLLYEEGALFKPHEDTEKTPGMFGTLVICLPSAHRGGAVRLTHGQEEKMFDTADLSAFNMAYIAWYADVAYEVEPVQCGYQWILTYNLVNISSAFPQSAAGLDAQITRFCHTLAEWHSMDTGPQYLCYAFAHQYSDQDFKLTSLKSNDYYRARYVVDSCKKAGNFCVLFANLIRVNKSANDEEGRFADDEDNAEELTLERIVDIGGFGLRELLPVSETHLLQDRLYDSRDPDEQKGGGYIPLANCYADIKQQYNDKVMVIVSRAVTSDFLLGDSYTITDFTDLLQRLQELFQMQDGDTFARELIIQICRDQLTQDSWDNITPRDLYLNPIAIAAIIIADQDLLRNTVDLIANGFNEKTFFRIGEVVHLVHSSCPENPYFTKAVTKTRGLHRIHGCLRELRRGFSTNNINRHDRDQSENLAGWVRDRISEALKSQRKAYPQDAAVLIELTDKYDDKMFTECINPFITQFLKDSDFLNALAFEVLSLQRAADDMKVSSDSAGEKSDHNDANSGSEGRSQEKTPDSSGKDLAAYFFPLILIPAATRFELDKFSSAVRSTDDETERGRRDADIVVKLYQELLQLGQERATELLFKVKSQIAVLTHSKLDKVVIPLLRQLFPILDLSSLEVCHFYQSIMSVYIERVVQKEPEKPRDWSQPVDEFRCACPEHQFLRQFLLEPKEKSRTFTSLNNPIHLASDIPSDCKITRASRVLTVRKTLKRWKREHKEWQERVSKVQDSFKQFPQTELQQCLADQYEAIMNLNMVRITDILKGSIKNHSNGPSGSMVPQKRLRSETP